MAIDLNIPVRELTAVMACLQYMINAGGLEPIRVTVRDLLHGRNSCYIWTYMVNECLDHCTKVDINLGSYGTAAAVVELANNLRAGKVVQVGIRWRGGDHYFSIVPDGDGGGRVLHACLHEPRLRASLSI